MMVEKEGNQLALRQQQWRIRQMNRERRRRMGTEEFVPPAGHSADVIKVTIIRVPHAPAR